MRSPHVLRTMACSRSTADTRRMPAAALCLEPPAPDHVPVLWHRPDPADERGRVTDDAPAVVLNLWPGLLRGLRLFLCQFLGVPDLPGEVPLEKFAQ